MKNINKIVDEIVKSAANKRINLGPGIQMSIKDTKDKQGFEIKIEGSFRSGNGMEETIEEIKKFWEKLDIDA
jgi:hypothetical protein